jgi:hypothetical protein
VVDVRRPIRLGATYTTSRTSRYSVSDLGFRRRNWHRWHSDSIVLEFCLVENLETPTGVGGAAVCCMAMPVCDSGDSQIANAATCPSNGTCYSRAACCTQIWCSHAGAPPQDAAVCNPSVEYNRSYVGQSPSACSAIKYACPANTVGFSNSCGCGCEQDASCTQYVDCMPGPATPNPLCSSSLCPYTLRAY